MNKTSIYCQNCRAANSLRETHCQNCGTRLLLVIFPNSLQYDTNHVPSFYEDHLLERVSLLELRLVQLSESLQAAMEIIREQGKIVKEEHQLVKSLYRKLGLPGGVEAENPGISADDAPAAETESENEVSKTSQIINEIIAEHDSPNRTLFTRLLEEGLKLLAQNEERQAFRMLERAALLSPKNVPLFVFIAEHLFLADKFNEAKKHLEQAFEIAPENPKTLFLLGVITADEADTEKARRLLSISANDQKTSPVVNYIWGILAAFEENWTECIAAFKQAMGKREIPELHYLIGCAYFQLNEQISAIWHLQRAVSMDVNYADSWFMQAVIYRIQKNKSAEKNALEMISEKGESGAQCREFLRNDQLNPEIALPFQNFRQTKVRLLTSGSLRLTRFFRHEIRKAFD